jgi:hypothetical protein
MSAGSALLKVPTSLLLGLAALPFARGWGISVGNGAFFAITTTARGLQRRVIKEISYLDSFFLLFAASRHLFLALKHLHDHLSFAILARLTSVSAVSRTMTGTLVAASF